MTLDLRVLAAAGSLLLAFSIGETAFAQKQGGTLRIYFFDSPASVSIHEETTAAGQGPVMGVFNNLVLYKQDVPQNGLQSIVPDLASEWSWDEDKTQLTFRLREGVKWHDGKPFSAKDVQCTWDLLTGKSDERLRINPRKAWYRNLDKVTTNGDYEVTFHLKRPQPAFIALLASGFSPRPRRTKTHRRFLEPWVHADKTGGDAANNVGRADHQVAAQQRPNRRLNRKPRIQQV